MNTHGGNEDRELPPGSTAGTSAMVRFAELQIGDQALLGNDLRHDEYVPMRGFNVALHLDDPAEVRRIFEALAEGGEVTAPLTELSWAKLWGMVTDRFGVPWLILARTRDA